MFLHSSLRRTLFGPLLAVCLIGPMKTVAQSDVTQQAATPPDAARTAMDEAYRLKGEHDLDGARAAFQQALQAGANAQVVWLELGYIAERQADERAAADAFRKCVGGPSPELAQEAQRELAQLEHRDEPAQSAQPASQGVTSSETSASGLLELAYKQKAAGQSQRAEATFRAAAHAGADAQVIALELAYLALDRHDVAQAKLELQGAARGPDAARRKQAESELAGLESGASSGGHLWADLYAEAFGWSRRIGAEQNQDLVPMLRLRAFYTPLLALDVSLYAVGQITRDLASRGAANGGLPLIYADNSALVGGGLLWRLWGRRLGLFAQIGPAFELLDGTGQRVRLDARVGAHLGLESSECSPAARSGSAWSFATCQELYAEATYVNRYDNDVIGFARGRSSVRFAITGPIEWQVTGELRVAKDSNNEYYNNFVDGGLGLRLRLLAPVRIELMFAPHVGTYFGLHHLDPAPDPLHYVDLRIQAATYIEVGP